MVDVQESEQLVHGDIVVPLHDGHIHYLKQFVAETASGRHGLVAKGIPFACISQDLVHRSPIDGHPPLPQDSALLVFSIGRERVMTALPMATSTITLAHLRTSGTNEYSRLPKHRREVS